MPSNLFSAAQIGTMTLPNRVIRSATQDPFGHRDGTCAPEQVALYRDIAAAGTGAIITAYSYISPKPAPPAFRSALPPRNSGPARRKCWTPCTRRAAA